MEFRILGPLEVADDGRLLALGGTKQRALLALRANPPEPQGERLYLIGRRHVRSNNSWLVNSRRLTKGPDRCTLLIHPDDARARGLSDGAEARVRSRGGEVVLKAEVSADMMPGTVSIPHGWGHGLAGVGLSVAAMRPGVGGPSDARQPCTAIARPHQQLSFAALARAGTRGRGCVVGSRACAMLSGPP